MADDNAQRLLDVIDDPTALDEFLGALTAENNVNDNVVASLARSLAAEFDVDSPNENLFDSSSANLTDISQSTVPFDFGSTSSSSQHFPNHDLNSSEYDLGISINQSEFTSYSESSSSTTTSSSAYKEFTSSLSISSESTNQNPISNPAPTPPPPPPPQPPPQPATTVPLPVTSTQRGPDAPIVPHQSVTQAQSENRIAQTQVAQTTQYASIGQLAIQQPQVLPGTSFIIDSTTGQPMMVTSGSTFGTNLLVAGVQPTYTVLPTQGSIFSNITVQPQIQAIKTTHGTTANFLQSTTCSSLVSQAQNTSVTTANGSKGKNPPQLLPKPSGNCSPASSTSSESNSSEQSNTIFVSNGSTAGTGNNVVVTSSNGSISMSSESLSQIIQQQAAHATVTNTLTQQPSFAIQAGGQVVQVAGMQNYNQLQGQALYMNQFGQQVLVPTMSQGGVQYIIRQQPQQQVLIQQTQTNNSGKVVRLMTSPQVPQQVQQNSIQLQQIQTPTGLHWVAVRPQVVSVQTPTPAPAPVVMATTTQTPPPVKTPTPPSPQPPKCTTPAPVVTTDTISATIQSVIERLRSPSPSSLATPTQQYSSPMSSIDENSGSIEPPPKKKPKYSKKKKVTLDLEQLLKQSGIMDEDLQDDGMDFSEFFGSSTPAAPEENHIEHTPSSEPSIPIQNGIHHNNNNNIVTPNNNFFKANGTPLPHTHILKPIPKSKQRKNAPDSGGVGGKGKKNQSADNTPVINNLADSTTSSPITPKSKKKGQGDDTISNSNIITPKKTPAKSKSKKKTPNGPANTVQPPVEVVPKVINPEPTIARIDQNFTQLPGQPRRYIQTIQLTPQNQTLLKKIQNQIKNLGNLTSRSEVEEEALQKLINLQTEVFKTGIPVPNPPHLQTQLNNSTSPLDVTPNGNCTTIIGTPIVKMAPLKQQQQQQQLPGEELNKNSVNVNGTTTTNIGVKIPPPLINKAKIIITTKTTTITENNTPTSTMDSSVGGEIKKLLQSSVTSEVVVASSQQESKTVDGSNTLIKQETKMTSSSGSIIPTTTISTTMCNTHQNPNGGLYYNSFDEKKLEEQLINRLKQEEETRIQWRKEEFEKRLDDDHNFFVNPDYETPFKSKADVMERLMHFHVGRDTADFTFEEFDEDFSETSCHLLHKFNGMLAKYKGLLLKESMKDNYSSAERVMLERMFVLEEKLKLEHDREFVEQGEILELPPPPPSWIPRIREMVDTEIKEMERDSLANQQVQSAIDSIMSFQNEAPVIDEGERIEYDAFGVPISNSNYNSGMNSSSADLDEAVRSILL